MDSFLQDYLERLTDLHQSLLASIDGLSPQALDWTRLKETSGEMNSINVLVTHLCGAERYWIGDVVLGDPSERVRAAEFEVHGFTAEALAGKINAATAYARSALENIDIDNLLIEKSKLRDGRPVTAGWALLHALEHTALHLGQIQITRQLWDEQHSDANKDLKIFEKEMDMYEIEIEIYEGKGGKLKKDNKGIIYPNVVREGICAWMYRGDGENSYQPGQRFRYPEDWGKLCPWLASSLDPVISALRFGGTLGWQYAGTPYVKEINPNGVTTEFVRCIDPTASGIVVKVIRTKLAE